MAVLLVMLIVDWKIGSSLSGTALYGLWSGFLCKCMDHATNRQILHIFISALKGKYSYLQISPTKENNIENTTTEAHIDQATAEAFSSCILTLFNYRAMKSVILLRR